MSEWVHDFGNWANATFGGLDTQAATGVCWDLKKSECSHCDEKFNRFIDELHNWFFVQVNGLIPTEHHGVFESFGNLSHSDREWVKSVVHRIRNQG